MNPTGALILKRRDPCPFCLEPLGAFRALKELVELCDISEMSCRDIEVYKYDAIHDDALGRARAILKVVTP